MQKAACKGMRYNTRALYYRIVQMQMAATVMNMSDLDVSWILAIGPFQGMSHHC